MLLGAYGFAISIMQGWPLVIAILVGLRRRVRLRAGARRPDPEAARRLPRDRHDLGRRDHQVRRPIGRLREAVQPHRRMPRASRAASTAARSPTSRSSGAVTPRCWRSTTPTWPAARSCVRLVGWLVVVGLIWWRCGSAAARWRSRARRAVGALVGLSVVDDLVVLFLAPVNQQNTGVDGWWFTFVAWVVVADQPAHRARLLTTSPWGRALARRPRGRGRDAQPRQERLRHQDAGAGHRRPVRRASAA